MSVSPFYALFRTPGAALAKFDPFPDEPLLKRLDPRTGRRPTSPAGRVRWLRLLAFWLLLTLPTLGLAWLQTPQPDPHPHTLDPPAFDRLAGKIDVERHQAQIKAGRTDLPPPRAGGLLRDVDLFSMWTIWACYLALIVCGRRLIGSLLITLERTDVVAARPPGGWVFAPENRFLRVLDFISRVDARRATGWAIVLIAINMGMNTLSTMADGVQTWRSDPLTAGSMLSFFHRGTEQANFAGLFHLGLASAVGGYLILLICRLYVVFAGMSEAVARDSSLRVLPTHPDGTGGLLPVGRSSLFISLGVFVSGLGLTAIVVQSYLSHSPLNGVFFALCAAYFAIGPMLFVLPLLPLRRVMLDNKQRYLLQADHLYQTIEEQHRTDVAAQRFDASALGGQTALATLIERAEGMTVWPFDRKTFRRFLALLVAPVVPAIKELPFVEELIKRMLGD